MATAGSVVVKSESRAFLLVANEAATNMGVYRRSHPHFLNSNLAGNRLYLTMGALALTHGVLAKRASSRALPLI